MDKPSELYNEYFQMFHFTFPISFTKRCAIAIGGIINHLSNTGVGRTFISITNLTNSSIFRWIGDIYVDDGNPYEDWTILLIGN